MESNTDVVKTVPVAPLDPDPSDESDYSSDNDGAYDKVERRKCSGEDEKAGHIQDEGGLTYRGVHEGL